MKFFAIPRRLRPLLSFLFSFTLSSILCASDHRTIVTTPSGKLRGIIQESVIDSNVKFVSFLGIPYAVPPVLEYRFKKSIPPEPWEGELDATTNAKDCLQINSEDITNPIGDEDCLYLNVFMPLTKENNASLKPVIVFIHGGGFSKNAGTSELFSPDFLMAEGDVILVAMNYRLHLFGFLNLDIPECSGNMALKDQVLALEWVQENIEAFRGDSNNVTLMGQSAGAHSAYLQVLSPMSRGLFHKVIIQSPVMPKVISKDPELYSIKFAQHLGYNGNLKDRREILRFINNFDGRQLTEAFATFSAILDETDFKYWYAAQPFKPALDARADEPFLPRSLFSLASEAPAIPVIMGSTNMDGAIAFAGNDVQKVINYVNEHLEVYLDPKYRQNELVEQDVIARVKNFYFRNEKMDENVLSETINLYTDLLFYHFETYNSFLQASFRSNKIYNYHFCFDGSLNFYKKRYLGEKYYQKVEGAVHTQDLSYLFYSQKHYPDLKLTEDDRQVILNVSKWWTNFAKTGDPNSDDDDIDIEWKPISLDQKGHLHIDTESSFLEERPHEQRRKFWDKLSRIAFSNGYSRFWLIRRWLNP